jgi:hypothetical protein
MKPIKLVAVATVSALTLSLLTFSVQKKSKRFVLPLERLLAPSAAGNVNATSTDESAARLHLNKLLKLARLLKSSQSLKTRSLRSQLKLSM